MLTSETDESEGSGGVALGDNMSTGEVARRLEDVVREVRDLTNKMMLKEVYAAQQQLIDARVRALEESRVSDINERNAIRRLLLGGLVTFIGSTALQIISVIVIKG